VASKIRALYACSSAAMLGDSFIVMKESDDGEQPVVWCCGMVLFCFVLFCFYRLMDVK